MVLEKSLNNDTEAIQDTQAKLAELSTMLGFFAEKLFEQDNIVENVHELA